MARTARTICQLPDLRPFGFLWVFILLTRSQLVLAAHPERRDPWHVHDLQHADLDQLAFEFCEAKSAVKRKTLAQFIC
jgi:hypothetical protein